MALPLFAWPRVQPCCWPPPPPPAGRQRSQLSITACHGPTVYAPLAGISLGIWCLSAAVRFQASIMLMAKLDHAHRGSCTINTRLRRVGTLARAYGNHTVPASVAASTAVAAPDSDVPWPRLYVNRRRNMARDRDHAHRRACHSHWEVNVHSFRRHAAVTSARGVSWLEAVHRAQLLGVGVPALFGVCMCQATGGVERCSVRRPQHPPARGQRVELQQLHLRKSA